MFYYSCWNVLLIIICLLQPFYSKCIQVYRKSVEYASWYILVLCIIILWRISFGRILVENVRVMIDISIIIYYIIIFIFIIFVEIFWNSYCFILLLIFKHTINNFIDKYFFKKCGRNVHLQKCTTGKCLRGNCSTCFLQLTVLWDELNFFPITLILDRLFAQLIHINIS